MSFLDEQATGQIGIGEKASLSTLTRRKRKQKKGQAPTGAETYSLMPQNEFSNIVSNPSDITQVGIGKKLQAQGTAAGDVPNVFEQYDSAAPLLGTKEAVYYQPPPDDDDDPGDDDDLPSVEDDPYVPDFDSGIGEGEGGYDWGKPAEITNPVAVAFINTLDDLTTKANETLGRVPAYTPGKVTPGHSVDLTDPAAQAQVDAQIGILGSIDRGTTSDLGLDAPPTTPVTPVTPVTPYDPGSFGAPDAPSGGSDISLPGYSGSTSDFGLD